VLLYVEVMLILIYINLVIMHHLSVKNIKNFYLKVITVKDATLKVEWLEGEYTEEFKFWKGRRGKTIIEEFPKRAMMGKVTLTASMRLTLKDNYATAEFV